MSVLFFFNFDSKLFKKIMMKKITFFITVFIFAFNAYAQNDLWPNEPVNTGTNATYLVNSVTFNDDDLIFGKIGAFFTNDQVNFNVVDGKIGLAHQLQIAGHVR